MNTIVLLEEMIDIALMLRTVEQTSRVSKIPLDANVVRLGSICILKWLRTQSITLRVNPLKLKSTSEIHRSCALLIERSEDLRKVFLINDGCLLFSSNIDIEEAKKLMIIARDKYQPPLLTEQ
jgi:hypothetical protein